MKTVNLKVGIKGAEALTVPTRIAENPSELMELARQNPDVVVRWANRGKRIEDQERSGARDTFREAVEKAGGGEAFKANTALVEETRRAIAKVVAEYDPTVAQARGGPRGPRQVTIAAPKGGKFTMDDFLAALKEKGINVQIEGAGAPAAQPAGAGAR